MISCRYFAASGLLRVYTKTPFATPIANWMIESKKEEEERKHAAHLASIGTAIFGGRVSVWRCTLSPSLANGLELGIRIKIANVQ